MEATLDVAKVTSKRQITMPKAIRKLRGANTGDKVLFYDLGDGSDAVRNARLSAFQDLQSAFDGSAEKAGIEDEDGVVELVHEIRHERAGT